MAVEDTEVATAERNVVAMVEVAAVVIATTALTVEAQATEAVDSPDTAMVEVEAHMAEAMALRLRRPTVVAHSLLLPQSPPLLNLPPQQ